MALRAEREGAGRVYRDGVCGADENRRGRRAHVALFTATKGARRVESDCCRDIDEPLNLFAR